ncbi:MAG: restriction endonuclease subunit S, partial [Muribaculaceae bacterium]
MKEPNIRFKEFSGEWEETTFGKISTNYKYGINAAAIPFDGTNKYLRITDIDEESRMFSQRDLTSPSANLSLCNDYLLEDGDITIARTGASVGKSYIYHEKDGKVYFAGFLIRIRLNKYIDKDCVYNITLSDNYSKHIRLVSQRSGQPGVNIDELKDFRFFLPVDFPEQQSIASFFTSLDEQIKAAGERIASLKQIKAASLQAMFPQEGETVPKLRFKGFTADWQKVNIGKIGCCYSGLTG